MIYLDNAATTMQDAEVTEAMVKSFEEDLGNPSSLHELGRKTQNKVNKARKIIAWKLGVDAEGLVFTSGGTESNNTVIRGAASALGRRKRRVVTTKIEHPAVLEPCGHLESQGFEVVFLDVDRHGFPDMEMYRNSLTEDVALVSAMAVNNELGTILPIKKMCELAHEAGALFHTDAVQGFGKMDLRGCDADFVSLSAHKLHGPKGVGAFYANADARFAPLMLGGGQEKNRRSGTENVSGIVGFGKAVELSASEKESVYVRRLKERLLAGLTENIDDIKVNGPLTKGEVSDYILNVSFLGTRGEVILHSLEAEGIYVSTGSACSSNKNGKSHVLKAIGCTEREIEGAIRFGLSAYNTAEEIDTTVECVTAAVKRFRRLGSFR